MEMHQFYFNECLPRNIVSLNDFASLLVNTIKEYNSLVKKNIGIDKGIILEKETENTVVCKSNLKNAIMSIPNKEREIRTLAYAYFTKYPIQFHLQSDEIDTKILKEDYRFENFDASNLAIAKHFGCFLFSVSVHDNIKKNTLQIKSNSGGIAIDNLYGEMSNTQYIERQINIINTSSLAQFEQLMVELKNPIYNLAFEKAFKSASIKVQKSIIENFANAPKRKLKTPYLPDNRTRGLIKDVTPCNNNKKAKIYELRVYYPEALRVYFYEYENTVFISGLGYKKNYKDESGSAQSKDIKNALNEIDKLIKTR